MLFLCWFTNKRMGLYACKQALLFGVNLILSCKCDVMFSKTATHKIVLPLNDSVSLPFGSKSVDNIRSIPNLRSLLDGGRRGLRVDRGSGCQVYSVPVIRGCAWSDRWRGVTGIPANEPARGPDVSHKRRRTGDVLRISNVQNISDAERGFLHAVHPKPPEQYAVQRLKFDA